MTSNESLRNYILQKIIKKVHLNKKTLAFIEDQTELSDDVLGALIQECAKYGFGESDARAFITQTANNITYSPSIKRINQNLSVDDINVGQHLSVCFRTKQRGELYMELVCLENNCFFVIKSSIPGLTSLDIINSMQTDWNVGYDIMFRVEREHKQYPDDKTFLQIGTFESVNLYMPSFIHKLFDSEDDFSFEGYLQRIHAIGNKYVDFPQYKEGYPVFVPNSDDLIPRDTFFTICPNDDKDTATLFLNTDCLNDAIKRGNTSRLSSVFDCCQPLNSLPLDMTSFKVVMEEPGVLQCNDLSSSEAFWFITAKPIISFC